MSERKQKKALKDISERLEQISDLLRECEEIAKEAKVSFTFSGPAYGMGGTFTSVADPDFDDSAGWQASSNSC